MGVSGSKQDYLKEGVGSIDYSCVEFKRRSGDFGSSVSVFLISVSAQVMSSVRTDRVGPTRIANPARIEIEFSAPHSNLRRQRVGKVFKADRQGLR